MVVRAFTGLCTRCLRECCALTHSSPPSTVAFLQVYMNGNVFPADVLDISEDVIRAKFIGGIRTLASLSLGVGLPTAASLPHSLGRAVREMLAVCAVTNYKLGKYSEAWDKLFNLSPEELAKMSAASAGSAAPAAEKKEEKPKKEEKKEEDATIDVGGGDLFGSSKGGKY